MDKVYDHKKYESDIYKLWKKSGVFRPKINSKKKPFTIIMPPPNASDPLHIGHARFVAIQDILIRYHRMKGDVTLWLPGSDHAGIETQYVFERKLRDKGDSRFNYNRETLYKMIWEYVEENKQIMENQLRQLGASCDWTRNKFTLDPEIIKVVYKTFKKLYLDGLIYRGKRIVNYCPQCGTNFSELEINHIERDDPLYYLNYGPLTIATTRPETIFADVAVAVNPKDVKNKNLIGKIAKIPLVNREVPIIEDPLVDPEFGTGALKVTPGHDPTDFEIGQKHGLPIISVIDLGGKMINTPKKYIGVKAKAARDKVVKDLKEKGLIKKTETIHHTVGVCYRDKGLIEPVISEQWFLKVKDLSNQALFAMRKGQVKFISKRYEKMAVHWLENLKDWNISRQIVWGIRIPAWRCQNCLEWTITDGKTPNKCASCGHSKITQDTDTFDTWFSSGQWPFATLQTTKEGDFEYFYPTSLMETAYEIIPFWVIRMVMLGLYQTSSVPFRQVLIHGLVRDRQGRKISKSIGNVIDPIDMVEKYGSDALRVALIWGTLVKNDISLNEDNVGAQRNFSNKIWNATRFVFMNKTKDTKHDTHYTKPRPRHEDDKKILKELKLTTKKVTRLMEKYRLNEAAEELYDFFWNRFANDYLEKTKSRREDAQKILEYVLQDSLKLLHPFMPFVTEAIWQIGFSKNKNGLLISSSWPS